jgi:hypothetical protein
MTMTNAMLVISEAISKGAKPLFTAEGNKMIELYLKGAMEIKEEKVAN